MAFTGTVDKCKVCDKTVHVVDMMTLEGIPYHKPASDAAIAMGRLWYVMFLHFFWMLMLLGSQCEGEIRIGFT